MYVIKIALILMTLQCFSQKNTQDFNIFIIVDEHNSNFFCKQCDIIQNENIFIYLRKKIPMEEYKYSLVNVIKNRLTKNKKKNSKKYYSQEITLILNFEKSEIKKIKNRELDNLNTIKISELSDIKFSSLISVLEKADNIYFVNYFWDKGKKTFKAYKVIYAPPLYTSMKK